MAKRLDVQFIDSKSFIEDIKAHDRKDFLERTPAVPDEADLLEAISGYLDLSQKERFAVLGIDIYRYSQYEALQQSLVPIVFKLLYDEAARWCKEADAFLFQEYNENFKDLFIDTGDGGYQIFETPLHAVVFASNFQVLVRTYNSYHFYPKLRKILGPINLRYVLTYDNVYGIDDKFYGPAIINNARILSKDNLNRFLIDEATYDWFMTYLNGVEGLQELTIDLIRSIPPFSQYAKDPGKTPTGIVPSELPFGVGHPVRSVDIMKIGELLIKGKPFSVYNLHVQLSIVVSDEHKPDAVAALIVSLGNINSEGLK